MGASFRCGWGGPLENGSGHGRFSGNPTGPKRHRTVSSTAHLKQLTADAAGYGWPWNSPDLRGAWDTAIDGDQFTAIYKSDPRCFVKLTVIEPGAVGIDAVTPFNPHKTGTTTAEGTRYFTARYIEEITHG